MSDSSEKTAEKRMGAVHRALEVISALADADRPLSVRQTAQALNLAPSTTHRLLNLLIDKGYASYRENDRVYISGPELFRVAAKIQRNVSPVRFACDTLRTIAGEFHQTVLFGLYLPTEEAMSFAAREEGDNPLMYRIEMDKPISLLWGASGKAILAHLPESRLAAILEKEGDAPASEMKKPDLATLKEILASIRERGYYISSGEKLPGACGIAAPVFDGGGVIGSICLTAPRERIAETDFDAVGRSIAARARDLSRQLGASDS